MSSKVDVFPIPKAIHHSILWLLWHQVVSYYLKKAAKIKKGNSTPGRSLVGKVTVSDIEKIAKEKMQDLNAIDLKGAVNMVKGSAVSMGMEVIS